MVNKNQNIAVAVNKNGKMWHGHFGISPFYYIYDINNKLIDKRLNPYGAGHLNHDHSDDQPRLIKELLYDCGVFIGKRIGEKSKLKLAEKLGVTTVLTKQSEPIEALVEYLK